MKKIFPSILTKPESLPVNEGVSNDLQSANKSFWEGNPMRYDWNKDIQSDEFSVGFYDEIDERFYAAVAEFFPWDARPFEQLMQAIEIKGCDVLEIGVGNGSHAELLAGLARTYTGVDLTEYAVRSTTSRLRLKSLQGKVIQMDAEKLDFPDDSFDAVWSWGVVHHSSNTDAVINQIVRVIRPGGRVMLMVYYRGWWNYYVTGGIFWLFRGGLLRGQSLHEAVQANTDGAIARYYTIESWKKMIGDRLAITKCYVRGPKTDLLPMPRSWLKNFLRKCLPGVLSRFLTSSLRMGGFLVCELRKPN